MHQDELLKICEAPAGSSVRLFQTEGSGLVSAGLAHREEMVGKESPLFLDMARKARERGMANLWKNLQDYISSLRISSPPLFPNLLPLFPPNKASQICPALIPFMHSF